MANTGPDTNDSHFSIMVDKAPHLDGHYTVFGEAVDGFEVGADNWLKTNTKSACYVVCTKQCCKQCGAVLESLAGILTMQTAGRCQV